MISFTERSRRLGNVGAIGAPLLCSFFVGSYGRLADSFFRLKHVDVSDLYFLSRLFLGHGGLWQFMLLGQAAVAALVAFWIHRLTKTLEWKLAATLTLVTLSMSSVLMIYSGCQIGWGMFFMRLADHALGF